MRVEDKTRVPVLRHRHEYMGFVYLAGIICLVGLVVCTALAAWTTPRDEWERVYFKIGDYPPRIEFEASADASDNDE